MQSIAIIIMMILGCSHPSSPSGWPSIDAESDSLMARIQNINLNFGSDEEKCRLMDSLSAMASISGNRQLLCRTAYWKASFSFQQGDLANARKHIMEACSLQDSARYLYDNMRLRVLRAKILNIPAVERYKLYTDALSYYLETGDSLMAGTICMDLGNVLHESGNSTRRAEFYRDADRLLVSPKGYGVRLRNQLNHANVSSRVEQIRIYEDLRGYPVLKRDSVFSELLWRNSFFATDEIEYLDSSDRYVRASERELVAAHLVWRADYWRKHMVEDSVIKYSGPAFEAAMENSSGVIRAFAILNNAFSLHSRQMTGEAMEMFPLYVTVMDSLMIEQADLSVAEADARMQIAEVDRLRTEQHHRSILRVGIAVIIVVCIFSVLAIWLVKTRKIAEMKRQMANVELMRRQDQLILSAMSIESKEKVIATLAENIDALRQDRRIGEMEAMKIKGQLSAVTQPDNDLDGLRQLRNNLNPEFELRLKYDYPDLTEHDLRLASLIGVGLTNKQIAERLAISHASVNTARYRLRMRIGLEKGESLEDFLRRYRR